MIVLERCQLQNLLAKHNLRQRVRLWRARIAPRSTLRRVLAGRKPEQAHLGEPSRFAAGTWVRIRDAEAIRKTLDAEGKLRGLEYVEQMWSFCGTTHQVLKPVRRLLDDQGVMRPISGTVLLATFCSGATHDSNVGCGRECPLWYRDEWLEAVSAPSDPDRSHDHAHGNASYATVKGAVEIARTLDWRGKHRGLMFMPEMYAYEGQRFRVLKQLGRVWEGFHETTAAEPVYILEGLHCTGAVPGVDRPCDRGCSLLWHVAWLNLESPTAQSDEAR